MESTLPTRRRTHAPRLALLSCLLALAGAGGCASATPKPIMATPAPATQASAPAPAAAPAPVAAPVADRATTRATGTRTNVPATAAAAALAARIDAFIAEPRFDAAVWGIHVVSLDSGRTLYAHDAGKLAIPASNAKLYTAALALSELGPGYRIRTSLYATATPRAGVLDGDLILYGRGDPTLGSGSDTRTPTEWADDLAAALAARGVTRVRGTLIADDTYFAGPPIGAGWEAGDLQSWFAPPASALSVQGNMFSLRVAPSGGLCCNTSTDPALTGVRIVNLTQTRPGAGYGDLGIYRPPGADVLYVYGDMSPQAKPRHFALAAPDPAAMAGGLLQDALARHGIRVDGGVHVRHWPRDGAPIDAPGTVYVADLSSPPLAEIVHHTLKHSDNLYAQLLLLQVGAQQAQTGTCSDRRATPRTTSGWGLCAMRAMLRTAGIEQGTALFEEGSGLSRKDLVTPRATTTLLAWAARQPFAGAYHDALPIAGVDGTLGHRMRHTAAADNLQAKTGTLRYSYTLSGYVTAASGERLAFSLMLDDYQRPENSHGIPTGHSPRRDLDTIATMLADYGSRR